MKSFITVIIFLTFYTTCFAQGDSTVVPFVSYWSKGDSYDFKITKIKQQWKGDILSKNDSSAYVVNFEVLDSTETSYRIKWSFETNLTEFNIPEALIDKFSTYKLTEVIYQTSELGEFVEIENWEEISKMMNSLLTDIIAVMGDDGKTDKEALQNALKPILAIYSSKAGVEQLVFKELQYFHFPFGIEFSINEPYLYVEQFPNMFGGKPIRGDAKIYIDSVDFDNSFCVLIQQVKVNPEDTKDIISALFKSMKLDDKELKKAMKSAKFDISDKNSFEYYFYPGIPFKIQAHRETLIDINQEKAKRIDITRIELIE